MQTYEDVPSGKTYTSQLAAESVKKNLSRTENIVLTAFYDEFKPKMFPENYQYVWFDQELRGVPRLMAFIEGYFPIFEDRHIWDRGQHQKQTRTNFLGTIQVRYRTISQVADIIEKRLYKGVAKFQTTEFGEFIRLDYGVTDKSKIKASPYPEYCTVQPRFPALERKGLLEKVDITIPNKRGREEQAYQLTEDGMKQLLSHYPWQHYRANNGWKQYQ